MQPDKRICRKWTAEEDALILEAARANRESRTSPEYFEYAGEVGYCDKPDCKLYNVVIPLRRTYHDAQGEWTYVCADCEGCGRPVVERDRAKRYTNRLREVAEKIGRTYAAVCKRASRLGYRSDKGRQRSLPMERKAS